MLTSLLFDVRYAFRLFVRSPGFVAIAVVSIAFGTGANVAIFSAVDALLLRPLPVEDPDGLFMVGTELQHEHDTRIVASYADFADIQARTRTLERFSALVSTAAVLNTAGTTGRVRVTTLVNAEFFGALAVRPALGRLFHPAEDDAPGGDAVAVLSHGIWQRDFGGDQAVVGRRFSLAGTDFVVLGVLPPAFTGLQPRYVKDEVYVPLSMLPTFARIGDGDPLRDRSARLLSVRARVRPDSSLRQAKADLVRVSDDLAREFPASNTGRTYSLRTELQAKFVEETFDAGAMLILSVLSIAVLAVACANVAGLLASRATVRGREIALRLAVGAGKLRIVRQLIAESLALALLGGSLGILVGYLGILVLQQIRMPTEVYAYPEFRLDQRALVFSLIAAVVSAFMFGLTPAVQAARVDLITGLKAADTGSTRRRRLTARSALVATQVALALMLLTTAVWAFEMMRQHLGRAPGFRVTHSAKVTLDVGHRASVADTIAYFDRAIDEALRQPGATSAAITSAMPLFSYSPGEFLPDGYQPPPGESAIRTLTNSVSEHYFRTMEIPIVAGRPFVRSDTQESVAVAIVNEVLATRHWPEGAVGERFRLHGADGQLVQIVGVARTSKYRHFVEPPQGMIYLPFRQHPRQLMVLVAATSGTSAGLVASLTDTLSRLAPSIPVQDPQTLEQFFAARATSFGLLAVRLIGAMGIMGVILSTIGLYGLVSYSASRRTREIGIRIAIGATAARIVAMVLHQGMVPAWVGLVAGSGLSVVAMNLLPQALPLNVAYHPALFVTAVLVLLATALLAAFIPARRSALVDPTVALRHD